MICFLKYRGLGSKPVESVRDFSVISGEFGLSPKSPIAVNTEDVDLLVMWLLLLTPFNWCGICSSGIPASQQENRCQLQCHLQSVPVGNKRINSSAQVYLITSVTLLAMLNSNKY